jgi:hypothetical protein
MIKVFTFRQYVTEENRKIIFPLLLDLCFYESSPLHNFYTICENIDSADIVIIPIDINFFFRNKSVKELNNMIDYSRRLEKIVWVYTRGDFGKTIGQPVYTFRLGGFNSKMDDQTFTVPALIQDPYSHFLKEEFQTLEKGKEPNVGFVGHSNSSGIKLLKEFVVYLQTNIKRIVSNDFDYQPFFASGKFRHKILRDLEQTSLINTNFIHRKRYRAGAKTREERELTTLEFYKNIKNNPYTICIRGVGNFSVRLYEVLAMGRIPVIVKTDNKLPLHWLNWEKHCIIVERGAIKEEIVNFHNSLNPLEFIEVQKSNKKFWKDKLTREGYFIEIYDYFKKTVFNEI